MVSPWSAVARGGVVMVARGGHVSPVLQMRSAERMNALDDRRTVIEEPAGLQIEQLVEIRIVPGSPAT